MSNPSKIDKEECKCELDGFQGAVTSQNCPIHFEGTAGDREIRDEISKILVKNSMPTRQVAISELETLFSHLKAQTEKETIEEIKKIVEEMKTFGYDRTLIHKGSLLQKLNDLNKCNHNPVTIQESTFTCKCGKYGMGFIR